MASRVRPRVCVCSSRPGSQSYGVCIADCLSCSGSSSQSQYEIQIVGLLMGGGLFLIAVGIVVYVMKSYVCPVKKKTGRNASRTLSRSSAVRLDRRTSRGSGTISLSLSLSLAHTHTSLSLYFYCTYTYDTHTQTCSGILLL